MGKAQQKRNKSNEAAKILDPRTTIAGMLVGKI